MFQTKEIGVGRMFGTQFEGAGGGKRVTVVSLGVVSDVVDRAGEILIYGSVCNARSTSRSL